ncbi:hypothetical protein [Rubrivirga sp. IMCC43871]|uniref:hypothetical protein n=1 Tax=Rubrivirga sp. IMCC43871 TaxID=3391575 RepID=UPI00398F956D
MRFSILRSLRPTPTFLVLLALFLTVDVFLIGMFLPFKLGWVSDPSFKLGQDGGFGELFGYAKALWIGLCAAAIAIRTRQPVFAAFAALFLMFLADDAGMLHEYWGVRIGDALGIGTVLGMRPHDVGEILFVGSWAGPILVMGALSYWKSRPAARRVAHVGLVGIGALAAFGIGMDVVHQIAMAGPEVNGLHTLLTTIEEGGEMMVLSVLAAGAISLLAARLGGGGPAAPGFCGDGAVEWSVAALPPLRTPVL